MTAAGNDISKESIFVEQLKTLMEPDDLVIAISASGNSPNVVAAIEYAIAHGAVALG
jgi:D-sedoheptulose 7-phosphate isomerase